MENTETPRIYVASLSDYNNGRLFGVWIDAAQDADDIMAEVNAMLLRSHHPNVVRCPECFRTRSYEESEPASCPECGAAYVPSAEEWSIHASEGFGSIHVGESDSFERVAAIASAIEDFGLEVVEGYVGNFGGDADLDELQEAYLGEYDSVADYAAEMVESSGELEDVPERLRGYIDYGSIAHDMTLGGEIWTHEAGARRVHIYRNV